MTESRLRVVWRNPCRVGGSGRSPRVSGDSGGSPCPRRCALSNGVPKRGARWRCEGLSMWMKQRADWRVQRGLPRSAKASGERLGGNFAVRKRASAHEDGRCSPAGASASAKGRSRGYAGWPGQCLLSGDCRCPRAGRQACPPRQGSPRELRAGDGLGDARRSFQPWHPIPGCSRPQRTPRARRIVGETNSVRFLSLLPLRVLCGDLPFQF